MSTPPSTTPVSLKSKFGFEDSSWQSHLSDAISVRMPDAPAGYQLLNKIGEGGQGTVYQARQLATGRLVAAKRLFGGRTSASDRFEREIQVLSNLSHPSIVSVVAAEREKDQRWLILDWVDGESIERWADNLAPGTDSVHTILTLFIEICDAVQHAHSRGVIHRDLKPSNILVDAHSRPRILDFGIAKIIDERAADAHTTTGSFLGTLGYAAPEQLITDPMPATPDIRVDVYSLGAVLYRLLARKDPLAATYGPNPTTAQAFKAATEHRLPPSLSSLSLRVPRDLDAVVLKSLHPDPTSRYATVDALRADLLSVLHNRPVTAQPPTLRYLAQMFVRRQRIAVSVAVVAFLLVISLTIFLGILSLQLSRRSKELAAAAQESQVQKQSALDLAEQRKKTAQTLAAMVQSLANTYSNESTIEALDGKLREAVTMVDSGVLGDDVDTEILLRSTLADTLLTRGMPRDALVQRQKQAQLAEAKYGPQSRQLANALNSQTSVLVRLGDYVAAEAAARHAIEIDKVLQAKGADPRSGYLSNLASVLHAQGKYQEAEALYRQRLAALLVHPESTRELEARAKRNISAELIAQNKTQEAEVLILEAIAELKSIPNPNGNVEDSLLRSYRNLALVRQQQGRLEDAETLQRQVIAGMIGLHGAKHLDLLQERVHLATILLDHRAVHPEKRAEALALLRDTETLFQDRVQPTSEFLVALRQLRKDNEPK